MHFSYQFVLLFVWIGLSQPTGRLFRESEVDNDDGDIDEFLRSYDLDTPMVDKLLPVQGRKQRAKVQELHEQISELLKTNGDSGEELEPLNEDMKAVDNQIEPEKVERDTITPVTYENAKARSETFKEGSSRKERKLSHAKSNAKTSPPKKTTIKPPEPDLKSSSAKKKKESLKLLQQLVSEKREKNGVGPNITNSPTETQDKKDTEYDDADDEDEDDDDEYGETKVIEKQIIFQPVEKPFYADKAVWIGIGVGAGFSTVLCMLGCCLYRLLLHIREKRDLKAAGIYNMSDPKTDELPTYVRLSKVDNTKNGTHYVVSM